MDSRSRGRGECRAPDKPKVIDESIQLYLEVANEAGYAVNNALFAINPIELKRLVAEVGIDGAAIRCLEVAAIVLAEEKEEELNG